MNKLNRGVLYCTWVGRLRTVYESLPIEFCLKYVLFGLMSGFMASLGRGAGFPGRPSDLLLCKIHSQWRYLGEKIHNKKLSIDFKSQDDNSTKRYFAVITQAISFPEYHANLVLLSRK